MTPQSFSLAQRVLHWTTVLLVLFNLLASEDMEHWWRAVRRGTEPAPDLLTAPIFMPMWGSRFWR